MSPAGVRALPLALAFLAPSNLPVSATAGPLAGASASWLQDQQGNRLRLQADGAWQVLNPLGRCVARSGSFQPFRNSQGHSLAWMLLGCFRFDHVGGAWQSASPSAWSWEKQSGALLLRQGTMSLLARPAADGVGFEVTLEAPGQTRVALNLALAHDEQLFGFGARSNGPLQAGRRVENWVQEGGNGKSERPLFGVSNWPTASHVPLPFCLSTQGVGLEILGPQRSVWDVGASQRGHLGVEVQGPSATLRLTPGPNPAAILKAHTARWGRPGRPPLWAFGPTEWGKGGSAAVLAKARFLRAQRIPASAMWFEDWVGLEHGPLPGLTHLPWGRWREDPAHYPGLAQLNATLEAEGFKSLGYFNPFLSLGDPQASEALAQGWALHHPLGHRLDSLGPWGFLAQWDLSHPDARAWMQQRLKAFEALGFDGAMVDFGEWSPVEARLHNDQSGWLAHNPYPDAWAQLHQGFWRQARPNGDFLTYTRAGWTQAASSATYMWAGDQNTDWGEDDGFPTALSCILSAGLSGLPLMTHDVGGFANLNGQGLSKELYGRWVAFGAFSSFMRSHSGQKPSQNWRLDSDADTLALHRRMAQAHMKLGPYRQAVVAEARRSGLPAMRHMWLAFPDAPEAKKAHDQYMLGPSLLVAPVFRPGATSRRLWLPAGTWLNGWDRKPVVGGGWVEVAAPWEEIPLFVRPGALLPHWPSALQSLVSRGLPGVMGLEAIEGVLRLEAYPGAPGALRLDDGAWVQHWPPEGEAAEGGQAVAWVQGKAWRVAQRPEGLHLSLPWQGQAQGEVSLQQGDRRWRLRLAGLSPSLRRLEITWIQAAP